MGGASFRVPDISQAEMCRFHEAHFSDSALDHFESNFLQPKLHKTLGVDEQIDEEDDSLGYYPDGVKRTLTEEQIGIFRHSELEAMRRAKENPATRNQPESVSANGAGRVPATSKDTRDLLLRKKKTKSRNRNEKGEVIDLRRRTWDKVDSGLSSLDYGDEATRQAAAPGLANQRRQISYDD